MTEEGIYENTCAETLTPTIKNSYLYCYALTIFEEVEKGLKRAVYMYNKSETSGVQPVTN